MGGLLREGEWVQKSDWEQGEDKSFKRQRSSFREVIEANEDARHPAEMGRYHLYVSYACPWAHRTLCVRALLGLEEALPISVVHPFMGDDGWTFDTSDGEVVPDPVLGADYLYQIYQKAKPDYTGRVTVPVLWDKVREEIVNNESREIIRMMNRGMTSLARRERTLCPPELEQEIDRAIDAIYEPINNGVYKCGFAGGQEAYERAYEELFGELERWDETLGKQRYVCGDTLTEADICLFTTLLRFDPVYYVHFKCNKRLIQDFEHLSGFLRDIYQTEGIAQTCNLDHIKRHYYQSHAQINPKGIVPVGPELDLTSPHDRDRFNQL